KYLTTQLKKPTELALIERAVPSGHDVDHGNCSPADARINLPGQQNLVYRPFPVFFGGARFNQQPMSPGFEHGLRPRCRAKLCPG
ncbi:hypothetical protein ACMWP8_28465, partial [Escherichia coli]|uniref:hypothetical protein n=1 Tax=Escherichia coli TaxID=562 RepID=UPI0039E12EF6